MSFSPGFLHRATTVTLVLALLMTALLVVIPPGAEASGEGWLNGWTHRKAIGLNPYASAETDSQHLFRLVGGTGTDANGEVYGITGSTVYLDGLTDTSFKEVRFTASDGTALLDHWIWQTDAANTSAFVWVEVADNLSITGTTIYVYWGNPNAPDASDGSATFPWFSGFDNATGLDMTNPQNVSFSNGIMQAGTGEGMTEDEISFVWSNASFTYPMSMIARYYRDNYGDVMGVSSDPDNFSATNRILIQGSDIATGGGWNLVDNYEGVNYAKYVGNGESCLSWNTQEIRWSLGNVTLLSNGVQLATRTEGPYAGPMYLYIESNWYGINYFDYAFFYDLLPTYNTVSSFGSMETGTVTPLDVSFTLSLSSGEAPLEVSFTPTNTGYDTYAWDFGDGNTSTEISPTHTYAAAGIYTVSLAVTETGSGLSSQVSHRVTVTAASTVTLEITSTALTAGQVGVAYQYQATCSVTVTSWYIAGADFLTISSSGLISGTSPNGTDGSFNVSVRLTLTDGSIAWQNYTLAVERQPYTADDGMAMAFGMLAFMMVISAIVGVVAMARRQH